jgi:hypothetical protein
MLGWVQTVSMVRQVSIWHRLRTIQSLDTRVLCTGTCPLHEAVRFFRKEVARVLLEFGAKSRQQSANGEVYSQIFLLAIAFALARPDLQR